MISTDIQQDPCAEERVWLVVHWLDDNGLNDDQLEPLWVEMQETHQVQLLCDFSLFVDDHLETVDKLWAQDKGSWKAARYIKALAAAYAKRHPEFTFFA